MTNTLSSAAPGAAAGSAPESAAGAMRLAHVFPGQGAQARGMGRDLFPRYPQVVAGASDVLGYAIDRLCLEDPEGLLGQTRYTQPAVFLVSALAWRAHLEDGGARPDVVAGHSLGEYTALFAAGAFDLLTGLRLVAERGRLMGEVSGGGMAAVIGLSARCLGQALQAFPGLDIANYNAFEQIVVAGPSEDLDRAEPALRQAGARSVVRLDVSAPFHSRAMRGVQAAFAPTLAATPFEPLSLPVISNHRAFAYREDEIAWELGQQIAAPVRWVESVEYMLRMGVTEFREIGPGTVLTRLIAQVRQGTVFA